MPPHRSSGYFAARHHSSNQSVKRREHLWRRLRRVRRDITIDELALVIDAAEKSPVVTVMKHERNDKKELRQVPVRMTYPERAWAYRIAAGTGFRAGEIASLTRESFDLDADIAGHHFRS